MQADEIYQKPSIYLQLEGPQEEEGDEVTPELRLVPADSTVGK